MTSKTYVDLIKEIENFSPENMCGDPKFDCGYDDAIQDVISYLKGLKAQNIIIMNKSGGIK